MRFDADVAVIGIGAFGASAAWRLAQRGVSVLGFEQYAIGHCFGSSHGETRLFRTISVEHEGLIPLAELSTDLYRELEAYSGTNLLNLTGGVMIGAPEGELISGIREVSDRYNLEYSELTSTDVRTRFPRHGSIPDDWVGLYDPNAGILEPESVIRVCSEAATANGARIMDRCAVRDVRADSSGVSINVGARTYYVDQVVVCAGAWTSSLVPQLATEVQRVPMLWFGPADNSDFTGFEIDQFPVFQRETSSGFRMWGHGVFAGSGVKLGPTGDSTRERRTSVHSIDRSITPDDWALAARLIREEFPGLNPQPIRAMPCVTTHTADGQYLVGRVGESRVLVAGAGNAHGFKHSTGIGDLVADIVTGTDTTYSAEFLNPNRF